MRSPDVHFLLPHLLNGKFLLHHAVQNELHRAGLECGARKKFSFLPAPCVRQSPHEILNLMESWEAYKGDKDVVGTVGQKKPLFKATKNLGNPSCTVSMVSTNNGREPLGYRMSWSRQNEWSKIYQAEANAPVVAEVSRKYGASPKILLDKDVLTLRVQPWMDQAIAMAMVMITNSMR